MAASNNSSDNSGSAAKPGMQSGLGFGAGRTPVMPAGRPGIERQPNAPTAAPAASATPAPRRSETADRTLIVGREIGLSGEITSCDRLVVEGSVEANLQNCRDIDIAESGLFKGSASIDDAEIRGRFEGTLIARQRLHIQATGKVSGTVSYAQVEIDAGGQLSGNVEVLSGDAAAGGKAGAPHRAAR